MTESDVSATAVVIRRPTKVGTDDRGQTVWAGPIEEAELDLMSSQDLKLALHAANDADRESIRAVAESGKDGVVARDRATGLYEIISEAELHELMDADMELSASIRRRESVPESPDAAGKDGLSLVSTQALHRMLNSEDSENSLEVMDDNSGVDPYDSG